jgi:hypothetical protein
MATWVVREDKGKWRVSCGRISKEFGTEADAIQYLRQERTWSDKIVLEEADGYRTPVTRRYTRRRHWRG